jgi:uncharacterized protein
MVEIREQACCTAFEGTRRIAAGELAEVATRAKEVIDRGGAAPVLIFGDETGETIEVDFRGTAEDVRRRLAERREGAVGAPQPSGTPRGPGRPRLGVVAREVTLLPRHWDWLNGQPGGASVALRRLVDEARHRYEGRDRVRRSQEAAYRFLSVMAGDFPGFEEATRALFAGDLGRFDEMVAPWPDDVREYARGLAAVALQAGAGSRHDESARKLDDPAGRRG